jgi:ureidoglycolate dehydrogenase (NAD+)
MKRFRPQDLQAYAAALLTAAGFAPRHAERSADILVWANARGAESHGVLRIPRYAEMVAQGLIDPVAEPVITSREGAVAVLDAHRAPGPSAMVAAMDEAIEIASRFGIGWCSAREITHAGAIGYFPLRAAERGYLGLAITASGPLMAYHGARVAGVSTNPLAIAVPGASPPLLLDMSTSTVALGKIMHAKDAGLSLPQGWAIDAMGAPATDPAKVATLTALGGAKGAGLSLMIEVMASLLVSNPAISSALKGGKGTMNGAALAIKIDALTDPSVFATQVAELAQNLKALPKAPGTDEILMPGERGFKMAMERAQNGIPLATGTLERLGQMANQLGVTPPMEMQPA